MPDGHKRKRKPAHPRTAPVIRAAAHETGGRAGGGRRAAATAVLAGAQDDPHPWRTAAVSVALSLLAIAGSLLVNGDVRAVLLVVAAILALPAVCIALFTTLFAWLPSENPRLEPARRRIRLVALLVAVLAGAGGVALYASEPGVGSYQASGLLLLPILLVVLVFLHRRIPITLQWVLAVVLALIGSVGYLIVGGPQWWNWGQFAIFPLVLLIVRRGFDSNRRDPPSNWYGGHIDGPWGPP